MNPISQRPCRGGKISLVSGLFEAFPLNPDDPLANGATRVRRSLETVLRTRLPHTIAAQRYDISGLDGVYQRRYWKVESTPVLDPDDSVLYIVQRVEDVTAHQSLVDERTRLAWERGRLAHLEAEAFERADAAEHRLKAVYQHAPLAMALLAGRQHVFEFANARLPRADRKSGRVGKTDSRGTPRVAGAVGVRGARPSIQEWTHLPWLRARRASRSTRKYLGGPLSQCRLRAHARRRRHNRDIAFVATDVSELVRSREEARAAAEDRDAERLRLLAVLEQSPLGITIAEAPSGGCSSSILGSGRFTDRVGSPRASRPIARTGAGSTPGRTVDRTRGMATLASHPAWRNDRERGRVDRARQGPPGRDHDQGRPHSQCPW